MLSVKIVPIGQIKPNPKNARTHPKKQVRQIAASMEKFGFVNPILTDEKLETLAGQGRLLGAAQLGMWSSSSRA
jgi:ParB-like chromosome segregation protein Spo0J